MQPANLNTKPVPQANVPSFEVSLPDPETWLARVRKTVGGQDTVIRALIREIRRFHERCKRTVDAPLAHSGFGKGVVLLGKPGTGKTKLASALAETSGLPYEIVNAPDIFQTETGAAESHLRAIFDRAKSKAKVAFPSIIVLDEFDVIAVQLKGAKDRGGVESRLLVYLLSLLDSLDSNVFVIGLSNRPQAINPCVTRSGRLDKRFELIISSAKQRDEILDILLAKLHFSADSTVSNPVDERKHIIEFVSKATHGFVPADLKRLCTDVAMKVLRDMAQSSDDGPTQRSMRTATLEHFRQALSYSQPSNLGEFQTKRADHTFADLYGMEGPIEELKTSIIQPLHHPEDFIRLGISPPRGVLVHGPPGVGKTALCTALANETGINFIHVEGSQLRSKIVGESEKKIANMFAQAKASAPCILFLDQLDVLAPKRGTATTSEGTGDRIVTSLLTEMDGFLSKPRVGNGEEDSGKMVQVDILVVAATNRPEAVDPAILRPGRLDQHVYIPPPGLKQRRAILSGKLAGKPHHLSTDEFDLLCDKTEGLSGADIENICREAALICLREDITSRAVHGRHFSAALSLATPSLRGYQGGIHGGLSHGRNQSM